MRVTVILSLISLSLAFTPQFTDVTVAAGIDIMGGRRLKKYGGPTIADLDRDGYYDLIFVHHGPDKPELYFNQRNATFTKARWGNRRDNHGTTAFVLPTIRNYAFFTLSTGGRAGKLPSKPRIFRVSKDRNVEEFIDIAGLDHFTERGRTCVIMPFKKKSTNPDVLFLNGDARPKRCPGCTDGQFDAYAYVGRKQTYYQPRILKGFNPSVGNTVGLAIDYNADRKLELLTWSNLTLHRIVGHFRTRDITRKVFGEYAYTKRVAAVAEIDYDNDGDFDLYIARDKIGDRTNEEGTIFPDLLLENRGGRYVNVSVEAGIPQNIASRGVTAADFNNDGYMDLYVTVLLGNDVMLLNNGNGTFRRHDIGIGKEGALGDNALAVDYDNDGRVDLIRSEGAVADLAYGGHFRILKNSIATNDAIGNWIKVRVGWVGTQTSQHAVVMVVAGGKTITQRVGEVGVQVAHSYIDTLHFGLGTTAYGKVTVTWLNGVSRTRRVRAGTIADFGSYT